MNRTRTNERARLAALLRQLRTEGGLRQTDLAKKLKEPQSFVSKYESGEQGLDIFEIREICEALGISLSAFVAKFEKEA